MGNWLPEGFALPVFDGHDARAVGWHIGKAAAGTGYEGCVVLQAGRCGDHFALILPPGASISCRQDGTLEIADVTFRGRGDAVHEPDCPSA